MYGKYIIKSCQLYKKQKNYRLLPSGHCLIPMKRILSYSTKFFPYRFPNIYILKKMNKPSSTGYYGLRMIRFISSVRSLPLKRIQQKKR